MMRLNPWSAAGIAAVLFTAGGVVRAADSNTDADVSKAVVEGVVVDENDKPVAGADVGLNVPFPRSITDRTAADGSFHLVLDAGAVGNAVVVRASADGGERQGVHAFDGLSHSRTVHARIVLKPCRKMTVRVADAANQPVEGAAVGVTGSSLLAQGETDAHGEVSLRLPRDAQVEQVLALKPKVGFDYFENYRSWPWTIPLEPPAQVNLTLNGTRSVSVRAVDSADKPVAGAGFLPWTVQKQGKIADANLSGLGMLKNVLAQADGDGIANLDWLPADIEGGVSILYYGLDYYLPDDPYVNPAEPHETRTAKLVRMTPIRGKVTSPDGKPAGGVLLQAEGDGGAGVYFRGVARTKADGTYSLFVYPDKTYIIAVTDEKWTAPSLTGVFIEEGKPREYLDFHLGKGTLIRGKATVGAENKPAVKQNITLVEECFDAASPNQGPSAQLVRWATTDADGRYEFRVGSGLFHINGGWQLNREEITVKGEETIDKDFHMTAPDDDLYGKVLKGVVLAETVDGKPVAGAMLQSESARFDGHTGFKGRTDEQGRFEVRRWAVKTFVYVRNPQGTLASLIGIGEDDEQAKIVLTAAGKLTGRVVDKGGKPAAGVRILCGLRIGPEANPLSRTDLYTQTDDAGRFVVTGVIPGAHCRVSAYSSSPPRSSADKEVPSASTETQDLGDLVFDRMP